MSRPDKTTRYTLHDTTRKAHDTERVLETPSGFAGEVGADFVGLKPGGAFHISCIISKSKRIFFLILFFLMGQCW